MLKEDFVKQIYDDISNVTKVPVSKFSDYNIYKLMYNIDIDLKIKYSKKNAKLTVKNFNRIKIYNDSDKVNFYSKGDESKFEINVSALKNIKFIARWFD